MVPVVCQIFNSPVEICEVGFVSIGEICAAADAHDDHMNLSHTYFMPRLLAAVRLLSCGWLLSSLLACSPSSGGRPSAPLPNHSDPSSAEGAPQILTSKQAELRARQIATKAYRLAFWLDAEATEYSGRSEIDFDVRQDGRRLNTNLALDFEEGTVQSIALNGVPVQLAYDGHHLNIPLEQLHDGANSIRVEFRHSYNEDVVAFHRYQDDADGRVYLYSDLEPYYAHRMFPCFDQPSLRATFELEVTAPAAWKVITNSRESERQVHGDVAAWKFPAGRPLSPFLFALHAGDYQEWEQRGRIPVRLFARRGVARWLDAGRWLTLLEQGLDYFATTLDVPYPFEKYDLVIAPDYDTAMESAAVSILTEDAIPRSHPGADDIRLQTDAALAAVAHQWFGNLAAIRWWDDLWLSNGLTTFAAAEAAAALRPESGVWLMFLDEKQAAYRSERRGTAHPIKQPIADTEAAQGNFDGISYEKAAAVLQQLQLRLGSGRYARGLHRYLVNATAGTVTSSQFFDSFSGPGAAGLKEWEEQWIERPGVNWVRARWNCGEGKPGAERRVEHLVLEQGSSAGNAPLREHHLNVGFYHFAKGPAPVRAASSLEVVVSGASTEVPGATGLPCPDAVIPNEDDRDFVRVILDEQSGRQIGAHLHSLADPLLRKMLWFAMWDEIVFAERPVGRFLETVVAQLPAERNSDVVSGVLGLLGCRPGADTTAMRILPGAARDRWAARLRTLFRQRLDTDSSKPELRVLWLGGLLSLAERSDVPFLRAMLGTARGLQTTGVSRWEIIEALCRAGATDCEGLIRHERTIDPGDRGERAAIRADVARPDQAVKRRWLRRILGVLPDDARPGQLSPFALRDAMSAYYAGNGEQYGQSALEPYLQFVSKLREQDQGTDRDYTNSVADLMFPPLCTGALLDRIDGLLRDVPDLRADVVQLLKLHRDEQAECFRARELFNSKTMGQR